MNNTDLPITKKLTRLSDHFYGKGQMANCDMIDHIAKDVRNLELKYAEMKRESGE
tara:strand:+ start:167 stop:331 length:165 start_codon:yes stop_codon:yes gene_type:complete